MATLKPHSNGPYSNTVIGTLQAVDGGLLHLVQRGGAWVGCGPAQPLLAVPNVTAHPSTTSIPTSYYLMWRYCYLCNLHSKWLIWFIIIIIIIIIKQNRRRMNVRNYQPAKAGIRLFQRWKIWESVCDRTYNIQLLTQRDNRLFIQVFACSSLYATNLIRHSLQFTTHRLRSSRVEIPLYA